METGNHISKVLEKRVVRSSLVTPGSEQGSIRDCNSIRTELERKQEKSSLPPRHLESKVLDKRELSHHPKESSLLRDP